MVFGPFSGLPAGSLCCCLAGNPGNWAGMAGLFCEGAPLNGGLKESQKENHNFGGPLKRR